MPVAVVGGGLYGICVALEVASRGEQVHLYERTGELLSRTSGNNAGRLHAGYHYPRSRATALELQSSLDLFQSLFSNAILADTKNYVAIAKEGSRVTADQYLAFCDEHSLPYQEETPTFVRQKSMEVCLRIEESRVDLGRLREICSKKIKDSSVSLHLRAAPSANDLEHFDGLVIATFADISQLAGELDFTLPQLRFDLYELPIVRLPQCYKQTNTLVMDGPFLNYAPLGRTENFILGDVEHGIRSCNEGNVQLLPAKLAHLIGRGIIPASRLPGSLTNFTAFIAKGVHYFKEWETAVHLGSTFSARTILLESVADDARSSEILASRAGVVLLLGGKLSAAPAAAKRAVDLLFRDL